MQLDIIFKENLQNIIGVKPNKKQVTAENKINFGGNIIF